MNCSECPHTESVETPHTAIRAELEGDPKPTLHPGDLVEVGSFSDILATLDKEGKLEGLPFQPEMLAYCGKRFRVLKHDDHVCTPEARRIRNVVTLDQLRCDGSAHAGCQAQCLLLWKESWLRRVVDGTAAVEAIGAEPNCLEQTASHKWLHGLAASPQGKFLCQATEMTRSSYPFRPKGPPRIVDVLATIGSRLIRRKSLPELWIWFSGRLILSTFRWWTRRPRNTNRYNTTPHENLDLRPGEVVLVRSVSEILKTLDRNARNRGLTFQGEMFHSCGRKFRVVARIDKQVNEHTGDLVAIKNPCIILESGYCRGQWFLCSRNNPYYWHETWLRRVANVPIAS